MKQVLRHKDKGNFFVRYIKSFFHALDGLGYAIKHEHNMCIILFAIVVVTFGGFYFKISTTEWLFCIIAMGLVSAVELINSAIEAVCDLVTVEFNPLVKIAKDTASGASLILCITSAFLGFIIFLPKILNLFCAKG